jgi:hypothetical protein
MSEKIELESWSHVACQSALRPSDFGRNCSKMSEKDPHDC